MNEQLKGFFNEYRKLIDARLPSYIEDLRAPDTLKQAMTYSLKAGGKRVRPLLLLATLDGFNRPIEDGLDLACAIEMIHTYSLIHDDLPAMDDDDTRRGQPTNHKVYGEAMAILAGDALLTYSFELITSMSAVREEPAKALTLVRELAKASGPSGMVGGQVADIEGENRSLTVKELADIHHHKTGDLLAYSIIAGAVLADASEEDLEHLRMFAIELGLLFQIKDDILDVEGDSDKLGKPVGSDDGNNKSTYPSLLGLDGAKKMLDVHTMKAKEHLEAVKMDRTLLLALTDYVAGRDH
ncbi:farnesyl-diphosphate synthase [Alkalihalophilus pseudofirmus]|uniref:polyprenyl synthetase family protein n=1 Tax=Alkalihalophilus pseudofirmus TaxID=79885 RepID=UPI00095220FA|nr:farnesyl-diphosphate synthase [Alkalihalophilus pseudofirmus]